MRLVFILILFMFSCAGQNGFQSDITNLPRTNIDHLITITNLASPSDSSDLFNAYYFDGKYTVSLPTEIYATDYTPTVGDKLYLNWVGTTACEWTYNGTSFVDSVNCFDKIQVNQIHYLSFLGIPRQKSVQIIINY